MGHKKHTAKSNPRRSNNTSLNDGVLLSGEWLLQKSEFLSHCRPSFQNCESQQTGGNIQRRNHPSRQIKLADNKIENNAQKKARQYCPESHLFLPWWHLYNLENTLYCLLLLFSSNNFCRRRSSAPH